MRCVCSERWKWKGKRARGKETGRKNKYRMESVSWRAYHGERVREGQD